MVAHLYHAADVARRDHIRLYGPCIADLALPELTRQFRLFDVVGARRAAAHIAFRNLEQLDAGDGAQQSPRFLGDALSVRQVASVVIGDADRFDRIRRRRKAQPVEKHRDIHGELGVLGGRFGVNLAGEQQRVVVDAGSAAGGVGDDGVHITRERLEIAARQISRLVLLRRCAVRASRSIPGSAV